MVLPIQFIAGTLSFVKLMIMTTLTFQYILKCMIGVSVCYALYVNFPSFPFYWSMISVAIVFSVEHSNNLAYDRMKANILGSVAGFGLYFIPANNLVLILLGIIVVISLGTLFKLGNAIRTALAALIIVIVKQGIEKEWWVALSRVICVVVGCVVALIITLGFTYYDKMKKPTSR